MLSIKEQHKYALDYARRFNYARTKEERDSILRELFQDLSYKTGIDFEHDKKEDINSFISFVYTVVGQKQVSKFVTDTLGEKGEKNLEAMNELFPDPRKNERWN